jgi:putative heme-binding domain-containing protein
MTPDQSSPLIMHRRTGMRLGRSLLLATALFASHSCPDATRAQPEPPPIAPTGPRSPAQERRGFHLPPGFEVQLVAAEPDIIHPINMAFDARGRLWVTTSIEYPFPAKGPKTKDTVKVLEDFGPDGRARKITTWADNLNIPIGVLPLRDGAIVHSIPDVWHMRDTTGVGRADRREVLYGTYGFEDTHGMTGNFVRGFDGWIYACHGFHNRSTIKAKDGSQITMESGNTYRFKADGSRVEYFTHGQVNPFGLCFDPLGNLYSCDCHSRPIYQLLRGAYYPSFGAPHDGLGFGPEMMTHMHGSTAIGGIVYYAAQHFPPQLRDNIFIGNVVTNRINRDSLKKHGSTYLAAQEPDFLRSDDPWFRPVCLVLGPDGAMYIADFYNRIIGHYEVPLTHPGRDKSHGRIWRIIYRGPDGKQIIPVLANWTKATVEELVEDLGDASLPVRMTAMHELVDRGGKAVIQEVRRMMRRDTVPVQRMHGLWVLERLGALDDGTLTKAADSPETGIRVHALRVLAERPKVAALHRQRVLGALKDTDALVQRCAAEVLGRHPSPDNLQPLLELRHRVPAEDTQLLHMVRMALRDQLVLRATWDRVQGTKWAEADRQALADVCLGVPSADAADWLLANLRQLEVGRERLLEYVHHAARYRSGGGAPDLGVYGRDRYKEDPVFQAAILKAIQQGTQERRGQLDNDVRTWAEQLSAALLASPQNGRKRAGIELAAALKIAPAQDRLAALLDDHKTPEGERKAAASALAAIHPQGHLALLGRLLADTAEPLALREHVAVTLGGVNQPRAQDELLKALASAPAKLQNAIALALAGSRQGAEKLLDAVNAGKASARLLQQPPVRQRLEQAKVPDLEKRLARLTHGLPTADERLQALISNRSAGFTRAKADPVTGSRVFEKHCAACHQIANKGSKIAPQLDGVGARGVERLLEDILDPCRNVDQAFRATTLTLTDGNIVSGLVLREEGAVLVLADAQGKEQRIAKDAVESRIVSQLSPMPANFGEVLSEPDLYHLLAYLLEQRATVKKDERSQ